MGVFIAIGIAEILIISAIVAVVDVTRNNEKYGKQ